MDPFHGPYPDPNSDFQARQGFDAMQSRSAEAQGARNSMILPSPPRSSSSAPVARKDPFDSVPTPTEQPSKQVSGAAALPRLQTNRKSYELFLSPAELKEYLYLYGVLQGLDDESFLSKVGRLRDRLVSWRMQHHLTKNRAMPPTSKSLDTHATEVKTVVSMLVAAPVYYHNEGRKSLSLPFWLTNVTPPFTPPPDAPIHEVQQSVYPAGHAAYPSSKRVKFADAPAKASVTATAATTARDSPAAPTPAKPTDADIWKLITKTGAREMRRQKRDAAAKRLTGKGLSGMSSGERTRFHRWCEQNEHSGKNLDQALTYDLSEVFKSGSAAAGKASIQTVGVGTTAQKVVPHQRPMAIPVSFASRGTKRARQRSHAAVMPRKPTGANADPVGFASKATSMARVPTVPAGGAKRKAVEDVPNTKLASFRRPSFFDTSPARVGLEGLSLSALTIRTRQNAPVFGRVHEGTIETGLQVDPTASSRRPTPILDCFMKHGEKLDLDKLVDIADAIVRLSEDPEWKMPVINSARPAATGFDYLLDSERGFFELLLNLYHRMGGEALEAHRDEIETILEPAAAANLDLIKSKLHSVSRQR